MENKIAELAVKVQEQKAEIAKLTEQRNEMLELLQDISNPRRGTDAEKWDIDPRVVQIAARICAEILG